MTTYLRHRTRGSYPDSHVKEEAKKRNTKLMYFFFSKERRITKKSNDAVKFILRLKLESATKDNI